MLKKCIFLLLLMITNLTEASPRLLFIPLDNRPVSLENAVATMQATGWDIVVPPADYIASYDRDGKPEELFTWLEENARGSAAIVASSDSLVYGGLVASRTHSLEEEVLLERTQRLIEFKKVHNNIPFYIFTTVMRSPKASSAPVEPAYYAQYGPAIFELGALRDKAEMTKLTRKDKLALKKLATELPKEVLKDLYERREKNLAVTEKLLYATENGDFDYLLLGRDDTAPFSDAHREARQLSIINDSLVKRTVRFFAGADQLGLVLLNRAVNKMYGIVPIVYTFYNEGKGAATIPAYEDDEAGRNVRSQIIAAGAWPATTPRRADLIMAVNTPYDGVTLSADHVVNSSDRLESSNYLLQQIKMYTETEKQVAVADIAYGNGADNALVAALFKEQQVEKLVSYGGWNTAANTIGFALVQGLQAVNMDKQAQEDLRTIRLLDDWAYQSNVRNVV
ncbi:MAG TPA: DUF4127 family protein, partial [Candidatus Avacidaminococcus intestinavium]|nr:DUF4127 family protein [Candidatus Avacidaminococcus intestinavium]